MASAAGWTRGDGVVDDQRQFHRLHVQPNLAGHDPRDVEHVLDDLRQPGRVAFERLEAARGLLAGQDVAAQQPRVADDGVQRRAQLVREHGEKLVLHPVGGLRLRVEPGVFQRHRRPGGDAERQPLVLLGEDAGLRMAEEQPAQHIARACPSPARPDSCAPAGVRAACRNTARSGRSADPA